MDSRLLLVLALLVAALLPASFLVAPDLYVEPTETERYAITHESTTSFDATIDDTDLEEADATTVGDLPPVAQQAFTEMRDEYERSTANSGWHETAIVVCPDSSLTCPAYDESVRTEFPSDAYEYPGGATSNTYSLLEADGERYLVETKYGYGLGFGALIVLPLVFLGVVLYGLSLGTLALSYRETHPYSVFGCTGIGLIVLALPHVWIGLGASGVVFHYVLVLLLAGFVGSTLAIFVSSRRNRRSRS
ncbi:hypothetical protein [Natronobacterium texcoconense]|uniref:Uncharacterized protein n=1 Tax=Natronobacterium texcoconense TaxID=1095778 RepID=A0A1H1IZ70_NATTX|nr:hypothetical protein [Natronobacterium texcoconense]SDR42840.1 hypothetical protein SAMN04489842_3938 [Natronobacterium texcoconense]